MIKYFLDDIIGLYSVEYNGVIVLECLSKEDLEELTIGEIKRLAESM